MLTRRLFTNSILASGLLALSGCDEWPPKPEQANLGDNAIDAHMHLFNGRDVPALGFLEQVILPDLRKDLPRDAIEPLAQMIVGFLVHGTPTAADELRRMTSDTQSLTKAIAVPPESDEQRLARAIDGYFSEAKARGLDARTAKRSAAPTAMSVPLEGSDEALLRALSDAAGVGLEEVIAEPAPTGLRALSAPTSLGDQLAPQLLDNTRGVADPRSLSIKGVLQWALQMTTDRRQIWKRARNLYGKQNEAVIFCNYLVDLSMWLKRGDAGVSDMPSQIALAELMARQESGVMVLNFVPFCPLRMVVEGDAVLERVKDTVLNRGFAGVKLYPSMGFRPDDNSGISFRHASARARNAGPTGAKIDANLRKLYAWCAANDVPIASHAAHTMAAGPGTNAYSAPWYWRSVLKAYPDLRVNLAHFGGFGAHSPKEWQKQMAILMEEDANLYFDTGYWNEAADTPDAALATSVPFFGGNDKAWKRMMYGSDWHMTAREASHPSYHKNLYGFVGKLAEGEQAKIRAVMSGNAMRWLGLDRTDGAQYARLKARFGGHRVWSSLLSA